jgi:hypothetical protein
MSDVEPEEIRWLWPPYIPAGKLTMLEGDPGLGKTFLALNLAAAVSQGYPLPSFEDGTFGKPRQPQDVLYLTGEDGLGDTLLPRLSSAGANLLRVSVLDGAVTPDGKRTSISLADVEILEEALKLVRPGLVIVDPIQAYLGGADMNKAHEVRPVMRELGRLAGQAGCAIIAIRHLRKSQSDRAVYRGLGSIDLAAAVRSILLVAEDRDKPSRRIVAHSKSNLAPKGASQSFEIREGRFSWTGASALGVDDLLAPVEPEETLIPRDVAREFLAEHLSGGSAPAVEVIAKANKAAISKRTLERAKADLGVKSIRRGFGLGASIYWELPDRKHRPPRGDVCRSGGLWSETAGEHASPAPGKSGGDLCEQTGESENGQWTEL